MNITEKVLITSVSQSRGKAFVKMGGVFILITKVHLSLLV